MAVIKQDPMVDNVFRRRIADVLQALIAAGLIGGAVFVRDMSEVQSDMAVKLAVVSAQITALNDFNKAISERITTGGFNADQGRALTRRVDDLESALRAHLASGVHVEADRRITIIERDLQQMRGGKDH